MESLNKNEISGMEEDDVGLWEDIGTQCRWRWTSAFAARPRPAHSHPS